MNDTKIEVIKQKIAVQIEFLRGLIITFIAILTGIVTVLHNVANGTSGIYMLISVGLGLIGLSGILAFITKRYLKIENLIKEFRNV